MVWKLVIALLLLLKFSVSEAQSFEGFVGGGITASQVSGDSYSGFNRLGGNLGIFTFYKLSENRRLSLGVQFVQKGSRKTANSSRPYNYELRLNYIEIPLEYQFKLVNKLYFNLGISYGRLMSYKEEADYAINEDPYNKDEINAIIGFNIPLKEKLFLTLNFDNTLFFSPIRAHKGEGRHDLNWGQYNSVIVTTLNYMF